MNTQARSEFDASYNDRVGKIRAAAAIALKELDQLRSGGLMTQEALHAEVARIAREKIPGIGSLSKSPVQASCAAISDPLPAA